MVILHNQLLSFVVLCTYINTLIFFQKKEKRIKELQLSIKKIADGDPALSDVLPISEEGSDWDDTWAVPDEVKSLLDIILHNKSCHTCSFLAVLKR